MVKQTLNRILTAILLLALAGAVGTVVYIIAAGPKTSTQFTEFYVLGSSGKAYDYPKVLAVGEEGKVTAGIISHEREESVYLIRVVAEGTVLQEVGPVFLRPEEKWEGPVTFAPRTGGESQKIEFLLYKNSGTGPYLSLYLKVDVVGRSSSR